LASSLFLFFFPIVIFVISFGELVDVVGVEAVIVIIVVVFVIMAVVSSDRSGS
jgi:hypothetical protein